MFRSRLLATAVVSALALVAPSTTLASGTGLLTQLSGGAGCIESSPTNAVDSCAADSLDGGVGLTEARSVAAYGGYVFVAGSSAAGDGIVVLKAESGGLTPKSCVTPDGDSGTCAAAAPLVSGSSDITGLTVSPDGKHLYASIGNGEIVIFGFNASTGALSWTSGTTGCVADGVAGCTALAELPGPDLVFSPSGAYAYSAGQSAVYTYSVGADGSLTPIGCVDETGCTGQGGLVGVQAPSSDFAASGVAISADGAHAYVPDSNDDAVWMFDIPSSGPDAGTLQLPDDSSGPVDYCTEDSSSGPAGLCTYTAPGIEHLTGSVAVSPSGGGGFVYAVSGGAGETGAVTGFTADLASSVGCVASDADAGDDTAACTTALGLGAGNDAVMAPDGETLYVASGDEGDGQLSALGVNSSTGALSSITCYVDDDASMTFPDCDTLQGTVGVDFNSDPFGALAASATGAATVSPTGSEVYVPAQTDEGVADLARNTGQYVVRGNPIPSVGGSVVATSSSAGAICNGDTCWVPAGGSVTLTATPVTGETFAGWSGGSCASTTSSRCTVSNVAADELMSADFLVAGAPTVTGSAAISVGSTGVRISAEVTGHGFTTSYSVLYGPSTSYGSVASGGTVSGSGTQSVSVTLSGLTPGTEYHYEVVATSNGGSGNGGDGRFTTAGHKPPPPPVISDVSATLTGLTSVRINGNISVLPVSGQRLNDYVEYSAHKQYGRTKNGPDPYSEKTHVTDYHPSAALQSLTGLSPGTTYDYRVVAIAAQGGTTDGANSTFTTPPPGPDVKTLAATGTSNTGATLNGTIDDMGQVIDYTFYWKATYDSGGGLYGNGCPGQTAASGKITGELAAGTGAQPVSAVLDTTLLPSGSSVSYHLVAGTASGFAVDSPGAQSFTAGTVAIGGAGTVEVQSASSAELAAVIPTFKQQPYTFAGQEQDGGVQVLGRDSAGGLEFTGIDVTEFGLFQLGIAGKSSDVGATPLDLVCGAYVTAPLSGLSAATSYSFAPVQAYGLGTCPLQADDQGDTYDQVDEIDNVDWCSLYSTSLQIDYFNGSFGFQPQDGGEYDGVAPSYPSFNGPLLNDPGWTPSYPGSPTDYNPTIGTASTFVTGVTSAPGGTSVNTGGGVTDNLDCEANESCDGTETVVYSTHVPTGASDVAARAAAARRATVVLGATRFSIRAHRRKTIRFELSRSGRSYLARHRSIAGVTLITIEHAGRSKPVTLRTPVLLGRTKRGRR